MRSRLILIIFLNILLQKAEGQNNLVPNPSFEFYNNCPFNGQQNITDVDFWFQPNTFSVNGGTDFYDTCSAAGLADVPSNIAGFQYPHSGGGYIGERMYLVPANPDQGREYAEVKLLDSLNSDKHYCVSFYVVLTESSNGGIRQIEAYLSNDTLLYYGPNSETIPVNAQIKNSGGIITDTMNWTLIKGIYNASGGESFLTIGNFTPGDSVDLSGTGGAYYYIDDVSVIELPELNAGVNEVIILGDSTALNGAISQQWPGMQFEWFPNNGLDDPFSLTPYATPNTTTTYTLTVSCPTCAVPCLSDLADSMTVFVEQISSPQTFPFHVPTLLYTDQLFMIDSIVPGTKVKLYDIRGRKVFESDNYGNDFSVSNLSTANYVYEVTLPDERIFKGKFCVVKR